MKKLFTLVILLQGMFLFGQVKDSLSSEKAIVYFVRANGLGVLINFTFFDGEKVIGRFNGPKYMRYECNPGKHLFWARSENKSYVEADLNAGSIYLIDVIPRLGGIKASVKLIPVDKRRYRLKKIQKLLSRRDSETFSDSELESLQREMNGVIVRGMKKYNKLKKKGRKILQLLPEMTVEETDLIYKKK